MIPMCRLVFALAGIAAILILIVITWQLRRTRTIPESIESVTLPKDLATQELKGVQEESRVSDCGEERGQERATTSANAQVCCSVSLGCILALTACLLQTAPGEGLNYEAVCKI